MLSRQVAVVPACSSHNCMVYQQYIPWRWCDYNLLSNNWCKEIATCTAYNVGSVIVSKIGSNMAQSQIITRQVYPNNISGKKCSPTKHVKQMPDESKYREKSFGSITSFKPKIKWLDLTAQLFIHSGCLYGLYLLFYAKMPTLIWFFCLICTTGIGITAGAHRLWSHKSYKAATPLQLLLIFFFTIAGQRDAFTWALDHRIHHKYSETDADPHNAKRGFFFAHIGWLFLTPHPDVVQKRKNIDMSDLEADSIVMFQKQYYIPLFALLAIAFPVLLPYFLWNESIIYSFWINFNARFCIVLNIAFCVNSVAHMCGRKPYDKSISPVENIPVAIAAFGEGWHNYHHVFPWDYKTGELGSYKTNLTTAFIDAFSKIGWAYERKVVSPQMIARRAARCGDGTHFLSGSKAFKEHVWGYGDSDIPKEDKIELDALQ